MVLNFREPATSRAKIADEPTFSEVLEQEARTLTDVGNRFQIRHSETSQVPLQRNDHLDYEPPRVS